MEHGEGDESESDKIRIQTFSFDGVLQIFENNKTDQQKRGQMELCEICIPQIHEYDRNYFSVFREIGQCQQQVGDERRHIINGKSVIIEQNNIRQRVEKIYLYIGVETDCCKD